MLDTRLIDDAALRCEALSDRIAATPVGANPHALSIAMAELDALERAVATPLGLCKLRDARHWVRLAYGRALHGYPADRLRAILIQVIADIAASVRSQT